MLSYRVAEAGAAALGGDNTVPELRVALEARGFSVFVTEQDLTAGEQWATNLAAAIRGAAAVVAVCSPTYGATTWTQREVQMADNLRKPIIPLWHSGEYPPRGVEIFFSGTQRVPRGAAREQREPRERSSTRGLTVTRRHRFSRWCHFLY